MFEFLNKVFGRAVEVEVVDYRAPEVILRSAEPLPLGINDVHATIAGVKLKARVQVIESGADTCTGFWLAPTEALPYLEEIFTYNEKRRAPRYARTLRIRSPQLEGFQGNSLDLSMEGLRLEGHGTLAPGSVLHFEMELDDDRQTAMKLDGRVCWCAPAVGDEATIVAGLEYLGFDAKNPGYSFYSDFLHRLAISELPLPEQP